MYCILSNYLYTLFYRYWYFYYCTERRSGSVGSISFLGLLEPDPLLFVQLWIWLWIHPDPDLYQNATNLDTVQRQTNKPKVSYSGSGYVSLRRTSLASLALLYCG
jgi:hypothetical protein